MKIRFLLIYIILFLGAGAFLSLRIARSSDDEMPAYPTEINRLVIRLGEEWDSVSRKSGQKIQTDEPFDYAVIGRAGNLLIYTKEGISTSVSAATTHFDVIRDIGQDGELVGWLLVHNPYSELQKERNGRRAMMVGTMLLVMLILSLAYFLYLRRRVVKPFDRMKAFAGRVAAGDLDAPLEMDRGHVFGAFTESFDIMREELKASREREAEAVKSRKELVAELSHDIKTPVASIKAMTDVMSLTARDDGERETIAAVSAKADQIDRLVSNLFHATLEELEQLEVKPEELSSRDILRMVKEADYLKKVEETDIADAVVLADPLRLNQVIGNVISNSYKYAGTEIRIVSRFEEGCGESPEERFILEISDRGGGVPGHELELITRKFKRGSNAEGKDGSGLGLYISGYFMEKMGGSLEVMNRDGGFLVRLKLKLC